MEHQHEEQIEEVCATETNVVNTIGSPLPLSSPLKPGHQGSFGSEMGSIVGDNEQFPDAEEGSQGAYGEELPGAPQGQLFADGEQDNPLADGEQYNPFANGEQHDDLHNHQLTVVKRCDQLAVGFHESSSTSLLISQAGSSDKHKVANTILCWVPADAHGPNSQSQHKVIFAQTDGKKDAGITVTRANACRSFASCEGCSRKNCMFFHYAPGDIVDDYAGRNPKLMRKLEAGVRHDTKHGKLFSWSTGDLAQLKEQNLQYAAKVRQQKIQEMRAARKLKAQAQMAYDLINAPIGEDELAEEGDKVPMLSKKRKKKRKDAKKSKKKKKKPLEEQPQPELTREQLLAHIADLQARADGSQ